MLNFNSTSKIIAVTLIAFLCFISSSANAQLGFQIGVLGGENFAGAQTLPSPFPSGTAQGASGYIVGIAFNKDLVGPISIQTELLLTQRTFKDVASFPSGSPNSSVQNGASWVEKLQYLQIPILLKISPIDGSVQPYGFIGPNIGIKLSASSITDSTGRSQTADQSAVYNSLDIGLDVGAGLGIKILPLLTLFADGRFTYGFADAYNHFNGSGAGDLSARDFKWTAGLMFGF